MQLGDGVCRAVHFARQVACSSGTVKLRGDNLRARERNAQFSFALEGTTEVAMDIVYAAEKPSIASLLGDYINQSVKPHEIKVTEDPGETGSFLVGWRLKRYVLSPSGEIVPDTLNSRGYTRGTGNLSDRTDNV